VFTDIIKAKQSMVDFDFLLALEGRYINAYKIVKYEHIDYLSSLPSPLSKIMFCPLYFVA